MRTYYTYILSNKKKGTLYIGVTNNIIRRVDEHRNSINDGFTKKYRINRLVYFEQTNSILSAIKREKQLKKWNRVWKIKLIESKNPEWYDLYYEINPRFPPARE